MNFMWPPLAAVRGIVQYPAPPYITGNRVTPRIPLIGLTYGAVYEVVQCWYHNGWVVELVDDAKQCNRYWALDLDPWVTTDEIPLARICCECGSGSQSPGPEHYDWCPLGDG